MEKQERMREITDEEWEEIKGKNIKPSHGRYDDGREYMNMHYKTYNTPEKYKQWTDVEDWKREYIKRQERESVGKISEDNAAVKDKADRLMDLAFPTKRDAVKKAKQGTYKVLIPGTKAFDKFGDVNWLGVNDVYRDKQGHGRYIFRRNSNFPVAAGVGAHEAGHDFILAGGLPDYGHDDSLGPRGQLGLMARTLDPESSQEDILKRALESGKRAIDAEHMANNTSTFGKALRALGVEVPDPRDSLPSKAVDLDLMLKSNPPAKWHEFKSPGRIKPEWLDLMDEQELEEKKK